MALAIFGITNTGLNLAVTLVVLMLVVVWISLIVYTFLDARRRIDDPFMVACATLASLFPFIGTAVYVILRPPEFIEDTKERHLEIQTAELKLAHLMESSCPNCHFPIEGDYLRCPSCQRRLKDPCRSCGKPVDPRWALCPFCETALPGRSRRSEGERSTSSAPPKKSSKAPSRSGLSARKEKAPRRSGSKDTASARGSSRGGSSRKSTPINARSEEVDAATAASRDSAPASDSAPARSSAPSRGSSPSGDPAPSRETSSPGDDAPSRESKPSSRRSSRPASGRRPQKPSRSSSVSSEEPGKRSTEQASPATKRPPTSSDRDPDSTETP